MTRTRFLTSFAPALVAAAVIALGVARAIEKETDPAILLAKADKLFEDKNYAEAAEAYARLLDVDPLYKEWPHASKRIVMCKLRLELFDEALTAADAYRD